MNVSSSSPLVFLALCGLAAVGGCESEERNAALFLLDRIEQLDHDDPLERHRRIEALGGVPAPSDELRTVRDECQRTYAAALRAEILSQEARINVEEAEAAGGRLSPEAVETIESLFRRSEDAAREAEQSWPRCEEGQVGLRSRFSIEPRGRR